MELGKVLGLEQGTTLGEVLGALLAAKDGLWLLSITKTQMYAMSDSYFGTASPSTPFGANSSPYPSACSVDMASTLIPSTPIKSPVKFSLGVNLREPARRKLSRSVSLSSAVAAVALIV